MGRLHAHSIEEFQRIVEDIRRERLVDRESLHEDYGCISSNKWDNVIQIDGEASEYAKSIECCTLNEAKTKIEELMNSLNEKRGNY